MVCDSSMKLQNVVAEYFVAVLYEAILKMEGLMACCWGILDIACKTYLLTPLLTATSNAERRYNTSHRRTRNITERVFGLLKRQFLCIAMIPRCDVASRQAKLSAYYITFDMKTEIDFEVDGGNVVPEDFNIRVQNTPRGLAFRRLVISNHFQS